MTISVRGVIFGSRLPRYGVNFARRFTACAQALKVLPVSAAESSMFNGDVPPGFAILRR